MNPSNHSPQMSFWKFAGLAMIAAFTALAGISQAIPVARAAPKAAIYTVTRADDPSPGSCLPADCSLREAVIAANANLGSTIALSHGVTYTLSIPPSGNDDPTTGNLNLTAATTINFGGVICAVSYCPATIQGGAGWNDDLLTIDPNISVQISGVVFTHGNAPNNGGAIFNNGTLTLTNSTIISNTANLVGGGIATMNAFGFLPSMLTLDTTDVVSNTTKTAGAAGVYIFGSATISNSSISYNKSAGSGGGIEDFGTLTMTNSFVTNNQSFSSGGGVLVQGTLTINGGAIDWNKTTDTVATDGGGGGIFLNTGALVVTGTDISHNQTPKYGGSIYASSSTSMITLTNATVNSNQGNWGGGGIFFSGAIANISNTTINSNNSGTTRGGGLFNNTGVVTLVNSSVNGNSTTDDGAGLDMNGGSLTISASTLRGNWTTGGNGGGILLSNGAAMTMTGTTVSGNYAYNGGGMYAIGSITLTNSTISTNTAANSGGGIYQAGYSQLLSSVTVVNNQAPANAGGGIAGFGITETWKNSLIAGNTGSPGPDCFGTITSQGYNLLGNNSSCSGLTNGLNGDQVGTSGSPINPLLGPLGYFGGPTQTHGPLKTSPALDKIPNGTNGCGVSLTQDQRSYSRPLNGLCDIGAFEGVLTQLFSPLILR